MNESLQYRSPLSPGIEALSCANSFAFTKHIHNGHVLWLNSEGGEQYNLKGCTTILQPGSVSIIEPGIVHSNRPWDPAKRHLRSLYLGGEFFLHLEKLLTGEVKGKLTLPTAVIENRKCWQLAILLHEAIINNHDQLLVDELIVSLFSRAEMLQFGEVICRGVTDNSSDRVMNIVEFMRARCSEDISLDNLAEIAMCTSYHVIRLFRNQVGMSPHAYLVQLRLERARELIDSGQSIADAALLAGFSDQSHLTRSFKKRYGLTPGLYGSQKLS
ncbi:AraC family transcriptional regulator [Desulfosediminicola flagellatus]|uniref:AraC family transcriptional regulator n=1 Tax=Desulfosediminicola flagellatus TaxID=2569541 RepID=UPI0010AB6246|nr:AraC family transcriptional regulator [Desulfosediminicola flagellatus]